MKTYKVYFNIKGLDKSIYRLVFRIEDAMKSELVRVYNIYADKANSGVTEKLNAEYESLNKGEMDLVEYNKFMADGYQRLIVDDLNKNNVSPILDFYIDPEEVVFTGMLKADHTVKIDFYLKEES